MKNIKLKDILNEAKLPKFRSGSDVVDFIDTKSPEFKKYYIKGASYDDVHYSIPMKLITKKFGWTEEDVETMHQNLERYEGWMGVDKNGNFQVGCSA